MQDLLRAAQSCSRCDGGANTRTRRCMHTQTASGALKPAIKDIGIRLRGRNVFFRMLEMSHVGQG